MQLEIEPNPNCEGTDQFVYNELGASRVIRAIRVEERGKEILCDVTGVEAGGVFVPATATKIQDSAAAVAWAITGGTWGIRIRPEHAPGDWDLADKRQWGEPFKIYGSEEDIIYA